MTTVVDLLEHPVVISVDNSHILESFCPVGTHPRLAEGALNVTGVGDEVLPSAGNTDVVPGVPIATVNHSGACRTLNVEKKWEQQKLESYVQFRRRLSARNVMQDMFDSVFFDPMAINRVGCAEYVARSRASNGVVRFAHQSDHVSYLRRAKFA